MSQLHVVIMAGGIGKRLYPLSTPECPKQFIDITKSGRTLIQETYDRFITVDRDAEFWVVTSERYVPFIHEQLPMIDDSHILKEPEARNTAPCIAYACWKIRKKYSDANVIVTPSDAYVPDYDAFANTVRLALDNLGETITTIGINPDRPSSDYGYIKACDGEGIVPVEAFKEKPSVEIAKQYLLQGGYYWNAGIFMFNIQTMISEIREYAESIAVIMDKLLPSLYTEKESEELKEYFPCCDKVSIDYAVMEKSKKVMVAPSKWKWSDLGSFEAIEKLFGNKI